MPDPLLPLKEALEANGWIINGLAVKKDSLMGGMCFF